ncbi:PTBP3 protein, partial [Tricholaema leucomelas]|nr:PTBP3 protein [Tricholaema leucomelas]
GSRSEKKPKMERMQRQPSRVLHLCRVPDGVTTTEVVSLGLPFGEVTNVLLLKGKNQALLEMATEEAAVNMVKHYVPNRPVIRDQAIDIQYSNYKELHTRDQLKGQAALRAVRSGRLAATGALVAEGGLNPSQGAVLRVILENPFYPITLEVLYQLFSKFGSVLKIITFSKNNKFQALLEYATPANACCAKMALDGQNIYNTRCILHVEFSRLPNLKIKYNNDKSRDFTRFDLPPGDVQPCLFHFEMSTDAINTLLGVPVPVVSGVIGSVPVTAAAVPGLRAIHGITGIPGSSVLLVRNFNSDALDTFPFWISLGVYGNVLRVKIMLKNKGTALVQMMDVAQAHLAVSHLNGQRIYGQVLEVSHSEYQSIQYPQRGEEDQELAKDYSNSPLHRFKLPGSRNSRNISPPSDTLHLCSIPSSVTADDMKKLFTRTGSTVKAFKYFEKDCRMALIQLGSVEEAVQALIELHNHDFGEKHHLRISFSKMKI